MPRLSAHLVKSAIRVERQSTTVPNTSNTSALTAEISDMFTPFFVFLERDDFSSNRQPALSFCLSMISAQTLRVCREGKPVSTPGSSPRACFSGSCSSLEDCLVVNSALQAAAVSRKGRRGSRFQLKYRKQPHAK